MRSLALLAAMVLSVPLALACGPHSNNNNNNPSPTPTTPPVVQPLTVLIDTDQTMTATGGDGVGVFVEYAAGGHWRLWWTCDTTHSNLSCGFTIGGNVDVGNTNGIRNLAGDNAAQLVNGGLSISSTTATEVHQITFDTDAGTKLTLDARVQGIDPSTSFFFFVQDGKINGGFQGKLTNPLIFQPTSP